MTGSPTKLTIGFATFFFEFFFGAASCAADKEPVFERVPNLKDKTMRRKNKTVGVCYSSRRREKVPKLLLLLKVSKSD